MTVVELGVALLVFAICAFWIVRHFHGLADAARDGQDASLPLPPGHLADTYHARPAVTPVPKTATIQSAGVRTDLEVAKPKVAAAMVKLDLPAPRPLAATASAARATPAKTLAETRPESFAFAAPATSPVTKTTLPIGPVPLPLSAANYAGMSVAAEAALLALAVTQPIEATTEHVGAATAPYLVSTSQRGARIIGADGYEEMSDEFWDMPAPRPKGPSIWSKSLRRSNGGSDLELMTILFGHQSVRAERLSIRTEPRRVGQSDRGGRRIRALSPAVETPSPPAQILSPLIAAAVDLEPLTRSAPEDIPQQTFTPTMPLEESSPQPPRSRIKRATKLVGKPRLEPDLKSKPVVATKVLGADPTPLKSRLPQSRKERRTRAVATPVRKLYLAGQESLPEPRAPSA